MRTHLVERLRRRAADVEDLLFLTGDLGFGVVEPLCEALGPRFVNGGVAEQNLLSMAGGLAACGFEPWCYSIAPFVTIRCLEQIRNDVAYEQRKVRIVGVGGGYSYGSLGPTHHSLEDATLLAAIPTVVVATPSTTSELDRLFDLLADDPRPVYWRIDREDGSADAGTPFTVDRPLVRYREGDDVVLITAGSVLGEVLAAADALADAQVAARVLTVPTLSPFPVDAVAEQIEGRAVLTVFEGFAGNPLEVGVLRAAVTAGVRRLAHADAGRAFAKRVGGTAFLRRQVGIDAASIAQRARAVIG